LAGDDIIALRSGWQKENFGKFRDGKRVLATHCVSEAAVFAGRTGQGHISEPAVLTRGTGRAGSPSRSVPRRAARRSARPVAIRQISARSWCLQDLWECQTSTRRYLPSKWQLPRRFGKLRQRAGRVWATESSRRFAGLRDRLSSDQFRKRAYWTWTTSRSPRPAASSEGAGSEAPKRRPASAVPSWRRVQIPGQAGCCRVALKHRWRVRLP